jgi:hypothetical protein
LSDAIADLAEEFEVWLSCVVYAERAPELAFSARQVRAIAGLGAAIDVDIISVAGSDVVL